MLDVIDKLAANVSIIFLLAKFFKGFFMLTVPRCIKASVKSQPASIILRKFFWETLSHWCRKYNNSIDFLFLCTKYFGMSRKVITFAQSFLKCAWFGIDEYIND